MKGNALVGQSGGPTAVINASLLGVVEAALSQADIGHVYGMKYGIEGFMAGELVDFGTFDRAHLKKLKHTPGSALGSTRKKLTDEDLPVIKDLLEKYDIRYFFLIGGNDTMDTINRVEQYCRSVGYELRGVGVSKTVDNDLFGTDHTPGFPSAARYVALSVLQGGRLAADMQRVDKFVVHQTVGRDAGWLAASSALAKKREQDAPHLIYIPERPLVKDKVITDVENTISKYGWCSIVVGEGALWEDGSPVSATQVTDSFKNPEFGAMGGASAALSLHRLIRESLGVRGEFQITESLPMCASDRVSVIDREEAYSCGRTAVEYAAQGKSGVMVTIERLSSSPYKWGHGEILLSEVARKTKPMPDEFIADSGNYVTDAFIDYLTPLVGELEDYAVLF